MKSRVDWSKPKQVLGMCSLLVIVDLPLMCQTSSAPVAPDVSYWHKVTQPEILPVWIGGVAAVLASIAAIVTLTVLRKQTKIGLIAAQTADKGAKAALLSAEAVMNAERAWIFAELGWHGGQPTIFLGSGDEGDNTIATPKITYKNEGRSPAWITNVYSHMNISSGSVQTQEYSPNECCCDVVVEPIGASNEISRSLNLSCSGHLKEDEYLHVYLIIEYRDIFNKLRQTRLAYSVTIRGHLIRQNNLPGRTTPYT